MADIEIDAQIESEGEAFDPRTPKRKPSAVKLQKRRDIKKQEAAATNYRSSAKYMRGRSV